MNETPTQKRKSFVNSRSLNAKLHATLERCVRSARNYAAAYRLQLQRKPIKSCNEIVYDMKSVELRASSIPTGDLKTLARSQAESRNEAGMRCFCVLDLVLLDLRYHTCEVQLCKGSHTTHSGGVSRYDDIEKLDLRWCDRSLYADPRNMPTQSFV